MSKKLILTILLVLALCINLSGCIEDSTEDHTNDSLSFIDKGHNSYEESNNDSLFDGLITESDTTDVQTIPTQDTITTPSETEHIHNFYPATCTTPQTCSCGAAKGKANGHDWKDATCSQPKTCIECGTTSGLTAGHKFSNGECTSCGKSDPDYHRETMVWIPTNGGTKYHSNSGCSNMDDPEQVTQSEAEELGFTPCKRCH